MSSSTSTLIFVVFILLNPVLHSISVHVVLFVCFFKVKLKHLKQTQHKQQPFFSTLLPFFITCFAKHIVHAVKSNK